MRHCRVVAFHLNILNKSNRFKYISWESSTVQLFCGLTPSFLAIAESSERSRLRKKKFPHWAQSRSRSRYLFSSPPRRLSHDDSSDSSAFYHSVSPSFKRTPTKFNSNQKANKRQTLPGVAVNLLCHPSTFLKKENLTRDLNSFNVKWSPPFCA